MILNIRTALFVALCSTAGIFALLDILVSCLSALLNEINFIIFLFPNDPAAEVIQAFLRTAADGVDPVGSSAFETTLNSLAAEEKAQDLTIPTIPNMSCFDFVIVGGGSAGAVVANRLSKYFTVLLLELGGEMLKLQEVSLLALPMVNHSAVDYQYQSARQTACCLALNDQSSRCSRGKGLGGCSNLNFMFWLRGHKRDFDNWANVTGDPRWNYESVRPFLVNTMKYGPPGSGTLPNTQSAVHVQNSSFAPLLEPFLAAAKWDNIPTLDVNEPYGRAAAWQNVYSTINGRRCSTKTGFLDPIKTRATLTIQKHSWVCEILINKTSKQAYGVRYERNGVKNLVACASKEVIISAGAIDSPKLLMLSGIGPKSHLIDLGIEPIEDLPVGENFQDHVSCLVGPFTINETSSFIPERDLVRSPSLIEYFINGKGAFTQSGVTANLFYPSYRAIKEGQGDWPDVQNMFVGIGGSVLLPSFLANMWNFPSELMTKYYEGLYGMDGFLLIVVLARPKQKGELKLMSADYRVPPLIDPKYFIDDNEDFEVLVDAIKQAVNRSENAPSFKSLGAKFNPNKFGPCDRMDIPFRSQAYWECFARQASAGFWHFVGTCRMGKPGSSVVSSDLKVHGIKSLRVIDASVMPNITNANTNAPTIMIADRGSQFILSDHGAS